MSLFSTLSTAVSGLNAQSKKISTVSNNLSNTSTTGYKNAGTDFEALVSDSSGYGVSGSTSYDNDAQGTLEASDVSTYMGISGNGYFAVKTAVQSSDGTLTFSNDVSYTRDGDFTVNADGYMVNSNGYYLLGWSVDPTTGDVDENTLVPVKVSNLTNMAVATSSIEYSANLSASATSGTTTTSSTVSIYDSLGTAHSVVYAWTKTDTNTWELKVSAADGDSSGGGDYSATIQVTFNSDGSVDAVDDTGSGYTVTGTTISFDLNYAGADAQTISCDLGNLTQYADSSETLSVSTFDQNGVAAGSFDDVSIDTSGNVSINYSNGKSYTYYEIPVATFMNSNALESETGNTYKATNSSGAATYSEAGSSGAGTIQSGYLEESTVDIASEYTNLITAQQVYSANAKAISTADSMIQTAIELKS